MRDKLRELTDKLYTDGVEKARTEARSIIAEAEKEREFMLGQAADQAAAILEQGRKEADALRSKTEAELVLAGRQAEAALRHSVIEMLSHSVLAQEVETALGRDDLLVDLIDAATRAWADSGDSPDPEIVLAAGAEEGFRKKLSAAIKDRLDSGMTLEVSEKIKGGFRVESRDGNYAVGFTDDDFQEYFRSFIKEHTRAILFGDR